MSRRRDWTSTTRSVRTAATLRYAHLVTMEKSFWSWTSRCRRSCGRCQLNCQEGLGEMPRCEATTFLYLAGRTASPCCCLQAALMSFDRLFSQRQGPTPTTYPSKAHQPPLATRATATKLNPTSTGVLRRFKTALQLRSYNKAGQCQRGLSAITISGWGHCRPQVNNLDEGTRNEHYFSLGKQVPCWNSGKTRTSW
ncbi:hypothetical protein LMG6000_04812 [Achromobacter insolitus]|uniref:Uncharacterized protein n=1 Tax=Achromobacter insolitus TaxID=217204 RepID=A0A6S7FCG1_9BURK|nr:hypothetical protein LMG6000_04812 [Achromobacter insolitus]CAB3942158.1 hypothetical protein LMG5997_04815 [Achromobacter insolitus]